MSEASSTTRAQADRAYARLSAGVAHARTSLGRPLTFAEKVLAGHRREPRSGDHRRGVTYADFDPDRVALQDALAQMVALQFMTAGLSRAALPTTVHCDHLIQARVGADADLGGAVDGNGEVYRFLESFCATYGVGFWPPGSGIIHQVVLEQYAFPGGMMIGTDSHTPNAGGLGMLAIGVGGGDAIDVMTGQPFTIRWPTFIGVHLTGSLSGWSTPKDVILEVARVLTVQGGTGSIVEYFGPGARTIAATGKATICNMGAELGATTSLFPCDDAIGAYLRATGRAPLAAAADGVGAQLRADDEVERDPGRFFDQVVEIDLSALRPLVNGPDSPDVAHRVDDVGSWARRHGVPREISAALIGSCTNSSYEDITRAASVARQARAAGLRARAKLYVTPGSEQIRATIERDGLLDDLQAIGATVFANACGPCIGQWDRTDLDPSMPNTIITSFNRNFPGRNDGSVATKAFVASPDMVIAFALAGTLDFNPLTDVLVSDTGARIRLEAPAGRALPDDGFTPGSVTFLPPPEPGSTTGISIRSGSDRLQPLTPFPAWDGGDYLGLPVLCKARGKCTTDQISAAGPWLRYRGHLEHISENLFLGVDNALADAVGQGLDPLDGQRRSLPDIARRLHAAGLQWCVVGDENYGEGSSREHAAMEPRYRGGVAVLARSFARIHETNLKKQGLIPLTFADPDVYGQIGKGARISLLGLSALTPGEPLMCRLTHPDGSSVDFLGRHTFSTEQIGWFRAGSALNRIRAQQGSGPAA